MPRNQTREALTGPEGDSAVISDCGRFRYRLTRRWDETAAVATFVMLNPSTADAVQDDPTIRRCIGFARSWGCGGLSVVNLYAYRATRPTDLWTVADPVGPDNDVHLRRAFEEAHASGGPVVAAWGGRARTDRVEVVLRLAGSMQVLALTKGGQPRHPLYLRGDLQPFDWASRPGDLRG